MNEPVLVVNANYEPLNVCSTRRALGLLFTGKAEMVANGRGYVHTVRLSIPRPSVIRLDRMIKRPRPKGRADQAGVVSPEQLPLPVLRTTFAAADDRPCRSPLSRGRPCLVQP